MNEDLAVTKFEQIVAAVKAAHKNTQQMVEILDGGCDALTTANIALHIQQALLAIYPATHNVIITPGTGSMMIRVESPNYIKTYGVMNIGAFDALVRQTHEPLENSNPNFKGHPMYLFGCAIESVLEQYFLTYTGKR